VLDTDPAHGDEHWRARVAVVLQSWRDHGKWRVRELLAHLGSYYACYSTGLIQRPWHADELMAAVGLTEHADKQIRMLSGGQRRSWTWPSGLWAGPSCCSWTSPPRGSTRRPGVSSTIVGDDEVRRTRDGQRWVQSTTQSTRFVFDLFKQYG
jgi:ABC-2 type transport system ATP-binding protein